MTKKKPTWEMAYAPYGGNQCLQLLSEGWEPFAVTPNEDVFSTVGAYVWFRRLV